MGNSLASQASWCLDMGSAGKRVIDLGYYRLGEGSHPGGAEILRTARGEGIAYCQEVDYDRQQWYKP